MKTKPIVRIDSHSKSCVSRMSVLSIALAMTAVPAYTTKAADDAPPPAQPAPQAPAEKPAPLPLHQIEGNGGIFSTLSAYIVNPPRDGEPVGRPSVGFSFVDIGHGQEL